MNVSDEWIDLGIEIEYKKIVIVLFLKIRTKHNERKKNDDKNAKNLYNLEGTKIMNGCCWEIPKNYA